MSDDFPQDWCGEDWVDGGDRLGNETRTSRRAADWDVCESLIALVNGGSVLSAEKGI